MSESYNNKQQQEPEKKCSRRATVWAGMSYMAVVAGIGAFMSGLMCLLVCVYLRVVPFSEFDLIGLLLVFARFVPWFWFWPLAAVGLVISTIALFTAPNKGLPSAGLALVLLGLGLMLASYAL